VSPGWWSHRWRADRLAGLMKPESRPGLSGATVLSVYRDHGVIPKDSRDDNFNRTPEDLGRYQGVRPGDLVVNRMKAWQGSLGVSELDGIVSPDYEVLRPADSSFHGRYLHHLLRSRPMIGEYAVRSTGIRPSQWRLYWGQMRDIRVPVPPFEEQRAIVSYLDRETAQIDELIAEQRRLISYLSERRDAVVSHEVLKSTLARVALRRVAEVVDCAHVTAEFVDDDVRFPVASIRECQGPTVSLQNCNYTTRDFFALLRGSGRAPRVGDLLFVRLRGLQRRGVDDHQACW
jgi:type I restriction enzyme, S subunit